MLCDKSIMGEFKRDIFERKLRTLRFDLEKGQRKEFNELCEEHQRNGSITSSPFLKLRAEMKENHLKSFLDIIIQSLLESFSENKIIDESQIKNIENLLISYSNSFIEYNKNGLQSAMYSYGHLIGSIIVTENVKAFDNKLNQVKYNARDLLLLAIENHNKNVKPSKSSRLNIFWDKYGTPIISGIIIIVIGGFILSLFI